MSIIDRIKNICLTPKTEWPVIAAEQTGSGELITSYVVPLAAVSAAAGFIGGSIIGRSLPFVGTFRVPIMSGLGVAIVSVVMTVIGVFVLGAIINALAPTFGGQQNSAQALKVAVYSATPGWAAGVLQILPMLGMLAVIGALYGLYLLYLGLPQLMKAPEEKAVSYTAVVVLCAIVLAIVIGSVTAMVAGVGMLGSSAISGALGGSPVADSSTPNVEFDPNSPLGKLQQLGERLEESNQKMEAAQQSGDASAQAAAALEGLGALFGGGKRVDPLDIERLKPFAPERFAGFARTSSNAEKNGMAGLMVSKVESRYGNGSDKTVTLEISDTGGVSGLVALAGWMNVQGEKEDESGTERTQKVSGRIIHEKIARNGGTNEYTLVLGDRFVVSATSDDVSQSDLKSAVGSLDLGKLEGMKNEGVQP